MITIAIIATNEEKNIVRAIRSAFSLGPVIVIDGGSTDETVSLARRAGAAVIAHAWPGYAAQRRFAIEHITTDWMIFLDADEEMTAELVSEIQALDLALDAYAFRRRSLFLGQWMLHGAWGHDYVLRLFRRAKAVVADRAVHEEVVVSGTTGRLASPLLHYAQNDFETVGRKFTSYVPLMAEEILKKERSLSMLAIVIRMKSAFFRDYFLRRGFLDGWRGFVLAAWGSGSVMAKYAEAKRRIEISFRDS